VRPLTNPPYLLCSTPTLSSSPSKSLPTLSSECHLQGIPTRTIHYQGLLYQSTWRKTHQRPIYTGNGDLPKATRRRTYLCWFFLVVTYSNRELLVWMMLVYPDAGALETCRHVNMLRIITARYAEKALTSTDTVFCVSGIPTTSLSG
jgi:hypothetical protein